MTLFTFPFNALGWPALAVGNVQIVGRPGDDAPRARCGKVVRVNTDLVFAHALADAADAITLGALPRIDLRVETKPDLTPVSEADRAAEEAIRSLVAGVRARRGRARRGVRRRRRRCEVDRRSDRRDDELRARHSGLGDAARARAGGRGRRVGLVSAPASAGAGGRLAATARSPTARRAASRRSRGSRMRPSRRRRRGGMPAGWSELVQRAWSNRGFGDFWQHCLVAEGALDVACDPVMQRVGLRRRAADRRGSRRPLHDLRRRRPAAGGSFVDDERRPARGGRLTSRRLTFV